MKHLFYLSVRIAQEFPSRLGLKARRGSKVKLRINRTFAYHRKSITWSNPNRIAKKVLKNHEEKIVFLCIETREMQQVVSHF